MSRYLLLFSFIISAMSFGQTSLNIHPDLANHLDPKLAPFYHGVASGDPTQDRVVIWTRITLDRSVGDALVKWEVSKSPSFAIAVANGEYRTSAMEDFTVKVDVGGLQANTRYYYRFQYGDVTSLTGEMRTLPAGDESFSIAFASCSNYEWGYFNNYRFIAEDEDVDLVVHLGDYIYEYGVGIYGDTSIGRLNVPDYEIVSLDDYRTRYSLYRLDPDLREVHRKKAFVTTWDDHEIANNTYDDGAQNHQEESEGDWNVRKNAARKVYYEWLPVRKKNDEPLYRSFPIGTLANLIMLDTRLSGRTVQVDNTDDPSYYDSTRTILGKKEYDWLIDNLNSEQTWKIVGNQVPFGPMYLPEAKKKEKYMDGWDGYPYEREKLVKYLLDQAIRNVVFVTGDYHESFAFETDLEGTAITEDNVAVEFVVTSITSANVDEYTKIPEKLQRQHERYLANNEHLKYVNSTDHGYLVLHLEKDKVTASFVYASTIREPDATKRIERQYHVNSGKPVLIED